ncbi:hypothetical protein [Pontibacter pamirensis]|nr:hypothetical protein [Pontibacter pamirensis]
MRNGCQIWRLSSSRGCSTGLVSIKTDVSIHNDPTGYRVEIED